MCINALIVFEVKFVGLFNLIEVSELMHEIIRLRRL